MSSKACFKCGEWKDLSEYYVHKQMGDGHIGKCKDCTKAEVKARRDVLILDPKWKEKEQARGREKNKRLGYKHYPEPDVKKQNVVRYFGKYPEKAKAKNLSQRIMPKIKSNQMHHWSYRPENAKDVIEMTMKDHKKAHRFLVYDQERMMYRRFDTNELLDNREAHEAFITECIEKKPD